MKSNNTISREQLLDRLNWRYCASTDKYAEATKVHFPKEQTFAHI